MSSQQQLGLVAPQGLIPCVTSTSTLGEVDHVRFLSENLSTLLNSDSYQDITLIVECQRIPAHKIILASRSEYFRYCYYYNFHIIFKCLIPFYSLIRALLFGGLLESQQSEIELKGSFCTHLPFLFLKQ